MIKVSLNNLDRHIFCFFVFHLLPLSDIQSGVFIKKFLGKKYLMPSNHPPEAELILKALKISFKRSVTSIK